MHSLFTKTFSVLPHILPWEVFPIGGTFNKLIAYSIKAENTSPRPSRKNSFNICINQRSRSQELYFTLLSGHNCIWLFKGVLQRSEVLFFIWWQKSRNLNITEDNRLWRQRRELFSMFEKRVWDLIFSSLFPSYDEKYLAPLKYPLNKCLD